MEAKKTYTYCTLPKVRDRAVKKAKREGMTLSERIDIFLKSYTAPRFKNPIAKLHENIIGQDPHNPL